MATGVRRSEGATQRPWTREARLLLAALLLVQGALAWTMRIPAIATRADDAEYILLAEELRQGHYRDVFYAGAPPHAKYPPGYPALLAAIRTVAGNQLSWYVAANVVLALLGTVLLLAWVRQNLPDPAWIVVGIVLALNPESLKITANVLSEPLFAFLTILGLFLDGRGEAGRRSTWASVATAASSIVRTAGLAICAGLLASRLFARRWRSAAEIFVATALTGGLWTWYAAAAPQAVERSTYAGDLARTGITGSAGSTIATIIERLPSKLEAFTVDQMPTALSVPTIPGTPVDNALGALLIVVLLPVGLYQLWKVWPSVTFALLGYGALNIVWPWNLVRYFVPLTPLIVVTLFAGAIALVSRLQRARTVVVWVLGAYLATGAVMRLPDEVGTYAGCDRSAPYTQAACFPQEGDFTFVQASRYTGEVVPPGVPVVTVKEAPFSYHSARQALNSTIMLEEDSATLAAAMRARGTEWLLTNYAGPSRVRLGRLAASACREFDLVRSFDPFTTLLRLRPAGTEPAWGEACEATRRWREPIPDNASADP